MKERSEEFQQLQRYINATPELQLLLYDLDLLPEQLDFPSHDGNRMIVIATWHRMKFGKAHQPPRRPNGGVREIISMK
jgi:hypothetical protein